jgi:membrane protease subunit (stomatin/prohibitin family)
MALGDFLKKQFIDVIQWTEEGTGTLACRYPMRDMEIQYGAQLTVRESQMALFVNEGKAVDTFGPGLHTLETRTLPLLTNLMNWDKLFKSPFKSDVYFFSTRIQTDQKWGTQQPITIRDRDFGMVRLRGFGVYAYHVSTPLVFHQKVSGTRERYLATDLEGQLRNTILAHFADAFAESGVPFLDMAANQAELGEKLKQGLAPAFAEFGLALDSFVVESLSLPDELQKKLDERIGMNMIGNMQQYAQYQAAQSMPIAAANEGGGAGLGAGLGAGIAMGKAMTDAIAGGTAGAGAGAGGSPGAAGGAGGAAGVAGAATTKFCIACGKPIPKSSKFCPECGGAQA